jgi:hypothetical protein
VAVALESECVSTQAQSGKDSKIQKGENKMPGEPEWFDVYKLEAIEIETATGEKKPSNIIDWGEDFFLKAYFKGSGPDWANLTRNGFGYVVKFYAEGMGPGVADLDLGIVTGNLVAGQTDYQVDSATTHINAEAIYRCGVMVTFRMPDGVGRWYGVLGHNEDCVIQISALEEIE